MFQGKSVIKVLIAKKVDLWVLYVTKIIDS